MEESSVRVEVGGAQPSAPDPPRPSSGPQRPIAGVLAVVGVVAVVLVALLTLSPDEGQDALGDSRESTTSTSTTIVSTTISVEVSAGRNPVDRLGSFDPESIVRTDEGFFAVGLYPEVRFWKSVDGVSWSELDALIDGFVINTTELDIMATLESHGEFLSLIAVIDGGSIHRSQSIDGEVWRTVEQIELPGGVERFAVGQTSNSIGLVEGARTSPMTTLLQEVLVETALDGQEFCVLDRSGITELEFLLCDDLLVTRAFSEADLRPGVSFEQVGECARALQQAAVPIASIGAANRNGFSSIPLDGGQPVAAAVLEARDQFVFLVDDLPGLRRRVGELGDNASSCENFGVVPEVPVAVGSSLFVVDAAGSVQRIDLPDGAEFNSSVSTNIGPQISAASDGNSVLVLLGDYVWQVDLNSGEWTQRLEREVTFASAGQTVLSTSGETLVLLGSAMRVGSVSTGEWRDIPVELPPQSLVVYVDDELVLTSTPDGTTSRIDLPRFE